MSSKPKLINGSKYWLKNCNKSGRFLNWNKTNVDDYDCQFEARINFINFVKIQLIISCVNLVISCFVNSKKLIFVSECLINNDFKCANKSRPPYFGSISERECKMRLWKKYTRNELFILFAYRVYIRFTHSKNPVSSDLWARAPFFSVVHRQ